MPFEILIQMEADSIGPLPDMPVIAQECRVSHMWPGFIEIEVDGEVSHVNTVFVKRIKEVE